MADQAFDPYYKWLAIPPQDQPPNLYRLLGVALFEADADVIETSADSRMASIRTFQAGKHAEVSQKILNEISAAKLTLLTPAKKAAYDQSLKAKQADAPAAKAITPTPTVVAKPLPMARAMGAAASAPMEASTSPPNYAARLPAARPPVWKQPLVLAGGAGAIVLVILGAMVAMSLGGKAKPVASPQVAVNDTSAAPPTVETNNATAEPAKTPEIDPRPAPSQTPQEKQGPVTPVSSVEPPTSVAPELPPAEPTPPPETSPTPSTPEPNDTVTAPVEPTKPAPPEGDELKKSQALVRDLYKDDIAAAKQPEEKRALAQKLIEQAAGELNDHAGRYAMLEESRKLAVLAGDYESASAAIEVLDETFALNAAQLRVDALRAASKLAKSPQQLANAADAAMTLGDNAAETERFDAAKEAFTLAGAMARKGKNLDLAKLADQRSKEIEAQRKAFDAVQAAQKTLADNPDDPQANQALGLYLCTVKSDWSAGLAKLAQGADAKLAELAQRDLAAAPDLAGAACAELGNDWYAYAQKERAFLARAVHWYEASLASLEGLEKLKIEKRLDELANVKGGGDGLGPLANSAVAIFTFEKATQFETADRRGFKEARGRGSQIATSSPIRLTPGVAGMGAAVVDPRNPMRGAGEAMPVGNSPKTLSIWARRDGMEGDCWFALLGGTREGGRGITFGLRNNQLFEAVFYNVGIDSGVRCDASWHHHCLTHDGQQTKYFIDTRMVGEKAQTLDTNGPALMAGEGPCTIDEWVIFDRALNEREVQRVYQLGRGHKLLDSPKRETASKSGNPRDAGRGAISLFNGRTLDGWQASENPGTWSVVDGVIQGSGQRSHLFYTAREFTDFELHVEARINRGGNSGVYFRTAQGAGFPKGYEAQISNSSRDPKMTGSLYNFVNVAEQLVADETWFTQTITCRGNHITIKVNDRAVVDFTDQQNTYAKGFVALQVNNPNTTVQFRNIRIQAIDAR